ncbi:MAG: Gfo/Idh/MocA family oxidoreductase, partial [Clostridiales bacterium]|nr:Gfo/Idh/MocA family oxidoreductase [Clostridiales bacterium]
MGIRHKILVAGCGSIGQRHARLLSQRCDTAVYVADPLKVNINACKTVARIEGDFSDYRDALNEKMDGVFICTPNNTHVDIAIDAIESGSHVFIEKPVATSVAEAEKLLRYEKKEKRKILVGYMNRFSDQLQEVKEMINKCELGNIVYANASVYTFATLLCAKTDYRDKQEWSLIGDYTHEIDFLRYLIGEVEEIVAIADTLGMLEHMPKPNVAEIMLRFSNKAIGSIHMDCVRMPDKRTLEVIGD